MKFLMQNSYLNICKYNKQHVRTCCCFEEEEGFGVGGLALLASVGACSCFSRLEDEGDGEDEVDPGVDPLEEDMGGGACLLSPLSLSNTVFRLFLFTVWMP